MRSRWLPLLLLCACRPSPEPPPLPGASPAAPPLPSATPALSALPPPVEGRHASVVHLSLPLPEGLLVAPASVALVRGELSDAALRGLREGSFPASAQARAVPLALQSLPGELRIFPSEPLLPGGAYTLAVGPLELRIPLVIEDQPPPLLERVWPPPGEDGEEPEAIFCGQEPLPEDLSMMTLGPRLSLDRGLPGRSDTTRCLTLRAALDDEVSPFPAALSSGADRIAALAPAPTRRASRPALSPLPCGEGELPFGPGCLLPLDDRAVWRLPAEPWLLLSGSWAPLRASGAVVLRGLTPASEVELAARLLDLRGDLHEASARFATAPPQPHVVLGEALADALGPEPASEWVELFNDGAAAVELGGWTFEDSQGIAALPAFTLPPGGYALLTNETLETSADAPVPPDCPRIRLPKLGKNGLSNEGEELRLRDAAGALRSVMPASPRPKPGQSLHRRGMDLPDSSEGAFGLGEPTPCGPPG